MPPSQKQLKFFVDPLWKMEDLWHIPLLFPLWGNPIDPKRVPFGFTVLNQHPFDVSYYDIVDTVEVSDMILMPYRYALALQRAPDILEACTEISRMSGKPLLIDATGDIEYKILTQNTIVLCYGGYRFSKQKNEIIIPPYVDDFLEMYCGNELKVRDKPDKPVVGFSGWASLTLKQELRTIIKELPTRIRSIFDHRYSACKKGVFFRREAIEVLQKSNLVTLNALVRRSYSGHKDTAEAFPQQLREEFVDNLLHSDYGLDIRGDANASARLFEILSLGRIPVIVDTERNFPFSDVLDYKTFSLIVDFRDLKHLPERIAEFHNSLTNEQFHTMQKNARNAYLQYFRSDALMQHIVREIKND